MTPTNDQGKYTEKIQSLTEKLLETFEELNLVYSLTEIFGGSSGVEQVIQQLGRLAVDRLESDCGWIVLRDERTQALHSVALQGVEPEVAGQINERLVGNAIEAGRPLLLNDLDVSDETAAAHGLHAFLAVPLSVRESILGAICISRRQQGHIYTSGDQKMLTVMASQGAMAISKHKLEKKLVDVERLAAVGEFAARVAHEVRNPLTSIKGFTFLIGRPKTTPDQVQQYTALIIEEIDRLDTIIKDILHFSRQSVLHPKEMSVEEVVDKALMLTEQQRTEAGIELVRTGRNDGIAVLIDPERMLQVFLNLIINATHAMNSGGALKILSKVDDDSVLVDIADTGCGIPPENLEQIFDPFFTTKETGTGLGLAIAKRILTEHQGDITVDSKQNEGTTFTIRLPRNAQLKPFHALDAIRDGE